MGTKSNSDSQASLEEGFRHADWYAPKEGRFVSTVVCDNDLARSFGYGSTLIRFSVYEPTTTTPTWAIIFFNLDDGNIVKEFASLDEVRAVRFPSVCSTQWFIDNGWSFE